MNSLLCLALWWCCCLLSAAEPKSVTIKVQDDTVLAILEQLADACDAHLVAHSSLAERLEAKVTLVASNLPWIDALESIKRQYGITLTLRDATLVATDSVASHQATLVQRIYDTRPLVAGVEHHPGPSLAIPDPGGISTCLPAPFADDAPPELASLADVIRRSVAPESWFIAGVSMEEYQGTLVITQTPDVHAAIAALLQRFDRSVHRQIVCRLHQLPEGTALSAVIDAAQWAALSPKSPVTASFSALDGQQNHHFSGIQRKIIADGDIVQRATDPIISIVSEGLCLEVTPRATVGGVLASIRHAQGTVELAAPSPMGTSGNLVELPIDNVASQRSESNDTRLVPPGGAALLRAGDRCYALTFDVLDYEKNPPTGK